MLVETFVDSSCELGFKIFNYLHKSERIQTRLVCKAIDAFLRSNLFWDRYLRRIDLSVYENQSSYQRAIVVIKNYLGVASKFFKIATPDLDLPQNIFIKKRQIDQHIKVGEWSWYQGLLHINYFCPESQGLWLQASQLYLQQPIEFRGPASINVSMSLSKIGRMRLTIFKDGGLFTITFKTSEFVWRFFSKWHAAIDSAPLFRGIKETPSFYEREFSSLDSQLHAVVIDSQAVMARVFIGNGAIPKKNMLNHAVCSGDLKMVEVLLQAGVQPCNETLKEALCADYTPDFEGVVDRLLKAGVIPSDENLQRVMLGSTIPYYQDVWKLFCAHKMNVSNHLIEWLSESASGQVKADFAPALLARAKPSDEALLLAINYCKEKVPFFASHNTNPSWNILKPLLEQEHWSTFTSLIQSSQITIPPEFYTWAPLHLNTLKIVELSKPIFKAAAPTTEALFFALQFLPNEVESLLDKGAIVTQELLVVVEAGYRTLLKTCLNHYKGPLPSKILEQTKVKKPYAIPWDLYRLARTL